MVVDSTDRERISLNKEELHKMLESDELCKAAVLVFANKQVMHFLIVALLRKDTFLPFWYKGLKR